jgi:iron complex transport system substrate-binding protein
MEQYNLPRPVRLRNAGRLVAQTPILRHLTDRPLLRQRLFAPILLLMITLLAACGVPVASNPSAPPAATPVIAATPTPAARAATPASFTAEPIVPQLPAVVTDYQGARVTIHSTDRIVSLTGDMTEIIFALGMGDRVVGVDSSATYPPEAVQELPNIGYQRRLSAEGVLSLNPTLIIGDESAGPPEALAQIRAAGVPVALAADPPTLAAPAAKISFVAQSLGITERGEALAAQVDAAIAHIQTPPSETAPRVLFLYLRGTDVQQVAGANTPADAMITAAGGVNAAALMGIDDFKPFSAEVVIAIQPDVLLVLEKGLESVGGIDGLLRIPGLADTPAGRNRRIIAFDDLYFLGMGPRTGQALADLHAALQRLDRQGRP